MFYFIKKFLGCLAQDIGIDLGTYTTSIYIPNQGIVLTEPSCIMYYNNKYIEYGHAAKVTLGKESKNMKVIRPLKYGVINNPEAATAMLSNLLQKVSKKRFGFIKPNIIICVPASASDADRKTIVNSVYQAGALNVYLVEEPVCAALGANISMKEANGTMLLDFGGGTVNYGIISIGGVVYQESFPLGGDEINQRIQNYIKNKMNINVGMNSIEHIKHNIGNAIPDENAKSNGMNIVGQDLNNNNPIEFYITPEDIFAAIHDLLEEIAQNACKIIQNLQPDLVSDIYKNGIILTGAGAQLKNLDKYLSNKIKIKCIIAENPDKCVVIGTGKIFESFNEYKNLLKKY